jgi:hypothetical protein
MFAFSRAVERKASTTEGTEEHGGTNTGSHFARGINFKGKLWFI